MRLSLIHLQLVDQPLLDGVLSSCVGGHAETLGSLPQLLLLLLTVRVGCGALRGRSEFAEERVRNTRSDDAGEIKMSNGTKKASTLAASTILAVASASSLAADSSLREFSKSDSPSASILMALTRSDVAWARIRA